MLLLVFPGDFDDSGSGSGLESKLIISGAIVATLGQLIVRIGGR